MKKGIKIDFSILLYVVCVLLVFIPFLTTYSRYTVLSVTEHYYESKEFYFTSDGLSNSTIDLYNWDGTGNYTFNINMNNFKDELNWTKTDIEYEYTFNCHRGETLFSCSANSLGLLQSDANNGTTNVDTITLTKGENILRTGDVVEVEVTATSTSPYEKSITGTYNVHVNEIGISYQIIDAVNSDYLTLLISNNGSDRSVNIIFDPNLINIDNTNTTVINGTAYTNDSGIINRLVINALENHVYTIRFYKNDITTNYSYSQTIFTIS